MDSKIGTGVTVGGSAMSGADTPHHISVGNVYRFEARDAQGRLKWVEEVHNLVTNVGLDDVLDKYLKGSAYTATWYVGLMSATPTPAAGDTMASHSGWTELTDYTEGARQTLALGAVSGQSVSNTASKAVFAINATVSIGGAFLVNNSTKGGTTGTLYSAAAFAAGNKGLDSGDTLSVTVTATAASA